MEQEQMTPEQRKVVVRIWVGGLLAIALMLAGFKGQQWMQERAKAEAAELVALREKQEMNAENRKAVLPLFVNTRIYQETNMLKVPIEDLPTSEEIADMPDATGGWPYIGGGNCVDGNQALGAWTWTITKGGVEVASDFNKNGWDVTGLPTGDVHGTCLNTVEMSLTNALPVTPTVSIPVLTGSEYGKYKLTVLNFLGGPGITSEVEFKITPPCPTGVSLNVTATPQQSSE